MLTSQMLTTGGQPPVTYGTPPTLSAVTASQGASGACSGSMLLNPATVVISWTVTPAGAAPGYSLTILVNGSNSGISGLSCATTSTTYTVANNRLNGLHNQFTINNVGVEVVRSDGTVMSTTTSGTFGNTYGTCS
jgi:hypothetical protein